MFLSLRCVLRASEVQEGKFVGFLVLAPFNLCIDCDIGKRTCLIPVEQRGICPFYVVDVTAFDLLV